MKNETITPVHIPALRTWELNGNSSRWDMIFAAPSDDTVRLKWVLWSLITMVVSIITLFVFISILISPKTRRNPFNYYLLFLMVPDIFFTFSCFIQCTAQCILGHIWSESWCYFQSFFFVFGVSGNAWMNAVVAKELCEVAKAFRRYRPPTARKIARQVFAVYTWSIFLASWGYINEDWWPHKTKLVSGIACIITPYDVKSTIFFYFVFFPLMLGIPMFYVLLSFNRIRKRDWMPKSGNRRFLALYFIRLAAVFVFMWLPAIILIYIAGPWLPHWVVWAGGTWSHLQGAASAIASLYKPDIGEAVRTSMNSIRGLVHYVEESNIQAPSQEDLEAVGSTTETQFVAQNSQSAIFSQMEVESIKDCESDELEDGTCNHVEKEIDDSKNVS